MSKPGWLFAVSVAFLSLTAARALADCVEEPRTVTLDTTRQCRENKGNCPPSDVPLKSYRCRAGSDAGGAEIRLEFYRLSDAAAGLLLDGGTTTRLRTAVGSTIVNNEVWREYADLVKRFGSSQEITEPGLALSQDRAQLGGNQYDDQVIGLARKTYRPLVSNADSHGDYPAVEEIAALRKKQLPANLSYYYTPGSCQNNAPFCAKFRDDDIQMKFWRPVQAADVRNYAANVTAYNAQLMQVRKDKKQARQDMMRAPVPRYLQLMAHVAGDTWPGDLVTLTASYYSVGCGDSKDLPGFAGWFFRWSGREIAVDFALVENVSRQPVMIDALLGARSADKTLRLLASETAVAGAPAPLDGTSQQLAPGQRILIPTRIVLLADRNEKEELAENAKSMDEMRAKLGLMGLTGNASSNRLPQLNDYAYGPELVIAGVVMNSARAELRQRGAANFINLTVTAEIGSCPYLLSWDDAGREWIEHGKVLHKAPSRDLAYTEARTFAGLRTHFRIEEREPEIAHIAGAVLVVTLDDGRTLSLAPGLGGSQTCDRVDLELLWGESVDLQFRLPPHVRAEEVVESRLELTGYYERYAEVLAQAEARRVPSSGRAAATLALKAALSREAAGPVCLRP